MRLIIMLVFFILIGTLLYHFTQPIIKYALTQQKKNVPAPKKTEQEKLIDKLEYFNDGKNRLSSRTGDTPTNTYVVFPELLVFYTRGLVHIKYSESPPLKTVYSKVLVTVGFGVGFSVFSCCSYLVMQYSIIIV